MAGFLSAHGYDPGPTQRPLLAGAISGALAAIPAVAVLWFFGSIEVESKILGLTIPLTLAIGFPVMAVAGAIYCRLFGRAANNLQITFTGDGCSEWPSPLHCGPPAPPSSSRS
jgi:hypothetical protein